VTDEIRRASVCTIEKVRFGQSPGCLALKKRRARLTRVTPSSRPATSFRSIIAAALVPLQTPPTERNRMEFEPRMPALAQPWRLIVECARARGNKCSLSVDLAPILPISLITTPRYNHRATMRFERRRHGTGTDDQTPDKVCEIVPSAQQQPSAGPRPPETSVGRKARNSAGVAPNGEGGVISRPLVSPTSSV